MSKTKKGYVMNLIEEFYGYKRITKKWAKLINSAREKSDDSKFSLVEITSRFLCATDGRQAIRVEIGVDTDIEKGIYFMTKDRILLPVESEKYPKVGDIFNKNDFTKTATLEIESPLVAMACAMNEFNTMINIDLLCDTFEAIADLEPVFVRMFGYVELESKTKPILMEFAVEEVAVHYAFIPLQLKKEDCVKVDNQPYLFDMKKKAS